LVRKFGRDADVKRWLVKPTFTKMPTYEKGERTNYSQTPAATITGPQQRRKNKKNTHNEQQKRRTTKEKDRARTHRTVLQEPEDRTRREQQSRTWGQEHRNRNRPWSQPCTAGTAPPFIGGCVISSFLTMSARTHSLPCANREKNEEITKQGQHSGGDSDEAAAQRKK